MENPEHYTCKMWNMKQIFEWRIIEEKSEIVKTVLITQEIVADQDYVIWSRLD